jgi:beta-mannanase
MRPASGSRTTRVATVGVALTMACSWMVGAFSVPGAAAVNGAGSSGAVLGDYVYVQPLSTDFSPIDRFIALTGKTPSIIHGYYGWDDSTFPKAFVDYVVSKGSMPLITWQPGTTGANKTPTSQSPLKLVVAGAYDKYFTTWATAAKAYPHTILVRIMHEMNGSWYAWGYGVNGNTPAQFVAAFQHVVNIFRQVGASNVQFVWCVSSQGHKEIPIQQFYPGDNYVDWVGMDGYNRAAVGNPANFTDLFSSVYAQMLHLTSKPIMIAETASVENPYGPKLKGQWILNNFLTQLPKYFPRVGAVVYFDAVGAGYTFPVTSSSQSLAAYSQVANNPYFQGKL